MKIFTIIISTILSASSCFADTSIELNERSFEGWQIRTEKSLESKPDSGFLKLQKLLESDLIQLGFTLPEKALKKLKQISITLLERRECLKPHAFHIDPKWLKGNCGMSESLSRSLVGTKGTIILSGVGVFLETRSMQPSALLHEFSHGFLALIDNELLVKELRSTFEKAKKARKYKKVLHYHGKKIDAYALTDVHEYFAEGSESYFGTNEFFPFVRPELKIYDPDLFKVLIKIWGNESSAARLRPVDAFESTR